MRTDHLPRGVLLRLSPGAVRPPFKRKGASPACPVYDSPCGKSSWYKGPNVFRRNGRPARGDLDIATIRPTSADFTLRGSREVIGLARGALRTMRMRNTCPIADPDQWGSLRRTCRAAMRLYAPDIAILYSNVFVARTTDASKSFCIGEYWFGG